MFFPGDTVPVKRALKRRDTPDKSDSWVLLWELVSNLFVMATGKDRPEVGGISFFRLLFPLGVASSTLSSRICVCVATKICFVSFFSFFFFFFLFSFFQRRRRTSKVAAGRKTHTWPPFSRMILTLKYLYLFMMRYITMGIRYGDAFEKYFLTYYLVQRW